MKKAVISAALLVLTSMAAEADNGISRFSDLQNHTLSATMSFNRVTISNPTALGFRIQILDPDRHFRETQFYLERGKILGETPAVESSVELKPIRPIKSLKKIEKIIVKQFYDDELFEKDMSAAKRELRQSELWEGFENSGGSFIGAYADMIWAFQNLEELEYDLETAIQNIINNFPREANKSQRLWANLNEAVRILAATSIPPNSLMAKSHAFRANRIVKLSLLALADENYAYGYEQSLKDILDRFSLMFFAPGIPDLSIQFFRLNPTPTSESRELGAWVASKDAGIPFSSKLALRIPKHQIYLVGFYDNFREFGFVSQNFNSGAKGHIDIKAYGTGLGVYINPRIITILFRFETYLEAGLVSANADFSNLQNVDSVNINSSKHKPFVELGFKFGRKISFIAAGKLTHFGYRYESNNDAALAQRPLIKTITSGKIGLAYSFF